MKILVRILIAFCFFVDVHSAAMDVDACKKTDRSAVLQSQGFLVIPTGPSMNLEDTFSGKDIHGAEKIYLLNLVSGEVDVLGKKFRSSPNNLKRLDVEMSCPSEVYPLLNSVFWLASATPQLEEVHLIGNHKNLSLPIINECSSRAQCIHYFCGKDEHQVGKVERFPREQKKDTFMKMMETEYHNIKVIFETI